MESIPTVIPWACVGWGLLVLAIGGILSFQNMQQRAPNFIGNLGFWIAMAGFAMMIAPLAVNGVAMLSQVFLEMIRQTHTAFTPQP